MHLHNKKMQCWQTFSVIKMYIYIAHGGTVLLQYYCLSAQFPAAKELQRDWWNAIHWTGLKLKSNNALCGQSQDILPNVFMGLVRSGSHTFGTRCVSYALSVIIFTIPVCQPSSNFVLLQLTNVQVFRPGQCIIDDLDSGYATTLILYFSVQSLVAKDNDQG